MQIIFWGTRGSLPTPLNGRAVRRKLVNALVKGAGHNLDTAEKAEAFCATELSFAEAGAYGGNTSCVQVDLGGPDYFLCDLGSGVREFGLSMMAKHGPAKPQTYHVMLSHVHWDHIMGFPFFIPGFIPGNKIRIYSCHPKLEQAIRAQNHEPCFPVEFSFLASSIEFVTLEPGQTYEICGAQVTGRLQLHGNDSYGYRIEKDGKTFVYSTDAEHKPEDVDEMKGSAEFFRGADLVVFDAMYSLADSVSVKEDWGHSSNMLGVDLCQMAGAKALAMFHHEPIYDDERIDSILAETVRYDEITRSGEPMKIYAAYDGLVIDLSTSTMGGLARSLGTLTRGWGRRAAWAVLILFVLLQTVAAPLFDAPRRALFDLYERVMPRQLDSTPVVIVAVDEASLAAVGQWPWPRQVDADLVTKILDGHPAALGIDLVWPEPDRQSPEQWVAQAGTLPTALADALRQLPSYDGMLAKALSGGPVVIGVGGADNGDNQKDTGKFPPVRLVGHGADPAHLLPQFPEALRSLALLDNAAPGHGVLSVDADSDGTFRHLPLLSMISGRPAPSLDLEMLRLAAKAPWVDLHLGAGGIEGATVGPLGVPTEPDGSLWVDFSPHDARRFVSAADVLAGKLPADSFDQRLVMISVTGLGLTDQRQTPLGPMPGTEVHAQLLENIIAGRLARRAPGADMGEPGLTLVLGLILLATLPAARRRWQVPIALMPLALLTVGGFGLWQHKRMLLDIATPATGLVLVFVALLAGSLAEADMQRRRLRRELEHQKLAAAKAEGELAAGRLIQMGILPKPESLADDHRFDLDALMIPARQIGGDLYDFFKIDADRLFFAIGDVSGKGVPAALFMALGKSLAKSCALREETDIGEIINRTNAEISRDNPEMLFITAFAGILDLATGDLAFCNAGHDAPWLVRAGAAPASVEGMGGPPLCVVEEFPYMTETARLEPGDVLCLTTDGVTEAMTEAGALMGRERVEVMLAALPPGVDARVVTARLHEAVDEFVAGAEASDDLTILTIRWMGPAAVEAQSA